MILSDAVNGLLKSGINFRPKMILAITLVVIVVGAIVWQTNVYFSKSFWDVEINRNAKIGDDQWPGMQLTRLCI